MKKLAVLALGVFLAACGETPTETLTMETPPVALAQGGGGVVAMAAGGGLMTWSNELFQIFGDEQYGFNVKQFADGSVKGQLQTDWEGTTPGVVFHMELDCLNVDGNQAIVGGTVTEVTSNPFYSVGTRLVFWIEDNGQGAGAEADRISFFAQVGPFTTCRSIVVEDYFEFFTQILEVYAEQTAGNIQIAAD